MSGGLRCFAGGCSLVMILLFKEYQGDWFECVIRDGVQTMYNQYFLNADIDRSGEQVFCLLQYLLVLSGQIWY